MVGIISKEAPVLPHCMVRKEMMSFLEEKEQTILIVDLEEIA